MKGNIVREESIPTDLVQILLFVVVLVVVANLGVLKVALRLMKFLVKPLATRIGRGVVAGMNELKSQHNDQPNA